MKIHQTENTQLQIVPKKQVNLVSWIRFVPVVIAILFLYLANNTPAKLTQASFAKETPQELGGQKPSPVVTSPEENGLRQAAPKKANPKKVSPKQADPKEISQNKARLKKARLKRARLQKARLKKAELKKARLKKVRFQKKKRKKIRLKKSRLNRAKPRRITSRRSMFKMASLDLSSRRNFNRNLPRRKSRSRHCLPGIIKQRLRQVEAKFGKIRIISSHRPGARIAGTRRPSYHRWCRAVDFTLRRYVAACKWLATFHQGGVGWYFGRHRHCHIDNGLAGRRWVRYGRRKKARRASLRRNMRRNFSTNKL